MAIHELVAQMLLWITVNTPYTMPEVPPEVTVLPREKIEKIICKNPCPVLAAYLPDQGVLLSDQLDLQGNVCDRSILLHELVHFFQHRAQGNMPSDRNSWALREHEAYGYQNRFLSQQAAIAPEPIPRDVRQCRNQRRQKMRQDFLNQRHQHSIRPPEQNPSPTLTPRTP